MIEILLDYTIYLKFYKFEINSTTAQIHFLKNEPSR